MAKNIQEAEVIVTMNGQAAKKAVSEISAEYERLTKAALEAHKAGNDALGNKLDADARKLMKDIEITRRETKKFADVMKNINGASLKELRSAAKQLQGEINKLTPGTQEFITKTKQLQEVNTRIRQLTGSFKGLVEEEKAATFSLKSLADGFNKYFGMVTAGIAAVTGLSMAFRKAAEEAAKLDDTYSDVMKTTGLMHDEVAELDKALMKINTRTSREQLLLLARDAGKLGIQGKENILGFVRAADQIQVALGEDLGEGAIKQLGKIADVLGYTNSMGIEKSLLSIGSAVNAVGQASTASEAYLVEFTQRLAGVAAQTNISAANIIGFASGLDQSAMKVEMASTAFQKFLMKLYEDPAKFAEYANLEIEKFTDLLKNDANAAVVTILKALKDQDGFASLVPIFKDMGLDGARAVSVLASMATNITAVTEAQALANVEFEKATSVTDEYAVKNNNMQAQLEKARKEFQNASIALGQSLNPIMLKSTKLTTYLIKALATYGKEIKNAVIAIAALTIAIKAKNIVQGISNALDAASITLTKTKVVVTNLVKLAYFKLTKQTEAAAVAQAALNGAMSASVFGIIAMVVAGLTVAITRWVKKAREANEVMDKMSEINKRINSEYAEGASKVQALTNIVHNNNLELDQRRRALNELKSIVPGYHADLTEEGRLINDNTDALKEYLKNLEKVTRQKILQEEYEKAVADVLNAEKTLEDATKAKNEALVKANGNTAKMTGMTMQSTAGAYSNWQLTPYGQALLDEADAQDDLTKKKAVQLEIEQRINNEFGIRAGQISDEDKAIRDINDKYKQLINETKEMYRDNPTAGNERIEELKEQQKAEIAKIHRDAAAQRAALTDENTTTNDILTQAQFEYLQERSDKLTKKEKEMVKKEYTALNEEESKALRSRYDKLMKADNNAADKKYQNAVAQLEKEQREAENAALRECKTEEELEKRKQEIQKEFLQKRIDLAKEHGKDISKLEQQQLTEERKEKQRAYDESLKTLKDAQKKEEMELKEQRVNGELTQKEYDEKLLDIKYDYILKRLKLAEQAGKDETDIMQEWLDLQVEATKLAEEKMDKMKARAKEVIAELHPEDERKARLEAELKELEELHKAKLLSEEDYRKKVKDLNKQYNKEQLAEDLANVQKYVEQVNSIMSAASDFTTALKEAESAKLEAEYQKQLAAAGDNAEQREQIEAEYEQKKLDLQKKYADVDMAINIAKTIASGAAAAIKAYEEGGPYAGPILAALVAATTAAEVATIIQQRNAIKNTSVSSSSSNKSTKTGNRTVIDEGYAEGGYTKDHTTITTVGEKGVEWVGPHWMVKRNPVLFSNLERYRKQGSHGRSGSISRGFAEGGFAGASGNVAGGSVNNSDLGAIVEAAIVRAMDSGAIRAYLVRSDLTKIDEQDRRLKKQTSRG